MKLMESWLREWVSPSISLEEIAHQFTQAGLEVEDISVGNGDESYRGIVVGEILGAGPHPNADRLKLCQVSDGTRTYSIVCGAANARDGIKVALALPGARLPQGMKVRKSKIRGEMSAGMICSGEELALEETSTGILELDKQAQAGISLEEYMVRRNDGNRERVLDIAVMPNRGDCLSVQGLARELAVLNDLALTPPSLAAVPQRHNRLLPIELLQPQDGCPRYLGRVITNVDLSRPSPLWLRRRLEAAGLRSIAAAVDITNYVMLELGQPLHAFDLAKIEGGIRVRTAQAQEQLVLLDGQILELGVDDLLIADHRKPLALAGVMGGKDSGISVGTQDIFLESAFFLPDRVRGKQRKYNFNTEAAHRFERGVDYQLPRVAMERATHFFVEILGGKAGPIHEAVEPAHLPVREPISLSLMKLNAFLGFSVPEGKIRRILQGLEMTVTADRNKDILKVTPPSFRFDVDCWEAIGEEIVRICGYDAVPTTLPSLPLQPRQPSASPVQEDEIRDQLAARGYQEIISYSFVSEKDYRIFTPTAETKPLRLANPISAAMTVMRGNLLAGLMNALAYNQHQYAGAQRLFEIGICFVPKDKDYTQETYLGGAILQPHDTPLLNEEVYDFYTLKGDLEALFGSLGIASLQPDYETAQKYSFLHPSKSLAWRSGRGTEIGYGGLAHPRIQQAFKLKRADVYFFELCLNSLEDKAIAQEQKIAYRPFSRFPPAYRDLSLVLDENMTYADLRSFILTAAGRYVQKIELFDLYRAMDLGPNKKSLSLRLSWQSAEETLTDSYINEQVERLLKQLADKKGIFLREA